MSPNYMRLVGKDSDGQTREMFMSGAIETPNIGDVLWGWYTVTLAENMTAAQWHAAMAKE